MVGYPGNVLHFYSLHGELAANMPFTARRSVWLAKMSLCAIACSGHGTRDTAQPRFSATAPSWSPMTPLQPIAPTTFNWLPLKGQDIQ